MAKVGDIVKMQKGTYKDRLGVVIAIRNNILCDVKLARPGERRSRISLDMPGIVVTNCLEIEDFIISK